MAVMDIASYVQMLPEIKRAPDCTVWLSYDAGADVLYVNFRKPSVATDSELTEDDIIVRYEGDEVIGFTVLHVSARAA